MIVNQLIAKIPQPYHLMSNLNITISVSIGISIFPADGVDANIIIKHADAAMYKAKRDGKNGFCFYHNDSNT
jgi:diguanylate cyclase (GGDEF)-like protein